jgi:hypothetical protein
MRKSYRPFLAILTVATTCITLAWSQEEEADEDLDLLKEAIQVLEKAKLSDELKDRRILQDLEDKLPDADKIIDLTKARIKNLQAKGLITKDALSKAASVVGADVKEVQEENEVSTGVLGPAPKKAIKFSPTEAGDDITIENSRQFAGNLDTGILVFEEDVVMHVQRDNMTVLCEKLEVRLDETAKEKDGKMGGVKTAIASGPMVVINALNDKGEPVEARCQLAIYEKDRIYLRLWPEVSMPGRLLKAQDKAAYIELLIGEDGEIEPRIHGKIKITIKKPEDVEETAP